ncbi:hypothetical protein FQN57_001539 [Myotisia sp. PD_48]|nr:hypothetical protein FQN57_001539 [Myotisia sp. PD_48]
MQAPGPCFDVLKSKGKSGVTYTLMAPDGMARSYTIEASESKPHLRVTKHGSGPNYTQTYQNFSLSEKPGYNQPFPPSYSGVASQGGNSWYSNGSYGYNNQYVHPGPPPGYYPGIPNENTSGDHLVATASFHTLSSKIDISLTSNSHGPSFEMIMKRPDPLSSKRRFETPTLGRLEWKEEAGLFSSNWKLVDQYKRVVARYEKGKKSSSSFWGSKGGEKPKDRFILLVQDPQVLSNLDQIVVTGFAMVEYDRQEDGADEEVASAVVEAVVGP